MNAPTCNRWGMVAALAIVLGLAACSMGTEVGNGLKPPTASPTPASGQDPSTSAAASSGSGGGVQTTSAPASAPMPPTPPSTPPPTAAAVIAAFDFPLDLLLTTCGSPFGQALQTPVSLIEQSATGAAGDTLSAVLTKASATWLIAGTRQVALRQFLYSASGNASAALDNDANGVAVPATFTCTSTVSEQTGATVSGLSGTFDRYSVSLNDKLGRSFGLVWYLAPATAQAAPALVRIEITQPTGLLPTNVVLGLPN